MKENQLKKIAAGIVVYNPDDEIRFLQCIESALSQVEKVYIFDNSTEKKQLNLSQNVTYMSLGRNVGIAYALNHIMRIAKKEGFEWVITLDQDSILPNNTIFEYTKYIKENDRLAIICPQVIDTRRVYMEIEKKHEIQYIEECITSASCTSINAWETVGGFDEWLFIDLVDNDFCKRLIVSGFKILRINSVVLNQEFGRITPKSLKKQEFWIQMSKIFRNKNIAKFSYIKYVDPIRVYYTNRNIIYVNRKLKKYGKTAYNNYNCKGYIGFLICFSLPSLLRAQNKKKVFKAIIQGIVDGNKKKVEQWVMND